MLSGVTNYLFGSGTSEPDLAKGTQLDTKEVEVPTRDGELGWVIVDTPESEQSYLSESPHQPHLHDKLLFPVESLEGDSTCSSDPESVGSQNTSTPESVSPGGRHIRFTYHSKLDSAESWILTPPPCFTAKRKSSCNVDTNPLENLLIEHPSMSVYTSLECDSPAAESCNVSQDAGDMDVEATSAIACREQNRITHQPPRRARAVAARAGLIAQIENVKVAQLQQHRWNTKKLSRKITNKENKVKENCALGKHQVKRARAQRPSGCMNGRMGQRKF